MIGFCYGLFAGIALGAIFAVIGIKGYVKRQMDLIDQEVHEVERLCAEVKGQQAVVRAQRDAQIIANKERLKNED